MIYTDSGKYAIRAMIYLAGNNEGRPVAAAEVAAAEQIPPFYLAKILQDLARAGLLNSARGRGGGFCLSRPPEEIPVIEVIEAVEDIRRLSEDCILGLEECGDEAPCPLHPTWKEFRDSSVAALRSLTVAELVRELERKRQRR